MRIVTASGKSNLMISKSEWLAVGLRNNYLTAALSYDDSLSDKLTQAYVCESKYAYAKEALTSLMADWKSIAADRSLKIESLQEKYKQIAPKIEQNLMDINMNVAILDKDYFSDVRKFWKENMETNPMPKGWQMADQHMAIIDGVPPSFNLKKHPYARPNPESFNKVPLLDLFTQLKSDFQEFIKKMNFLAFHDTSDSTTLKK